MENTGWSGLFKTLWQRVVLSYKTTLIGIGIAAVAVIADNFANSPNKILSVIGGIVAAALALYKEANPAVQASAVK